MKKLINRTNAKLFFYGLAELIAVVLMTAAFIAGTYVEQALWAMPDRVNFRQCLPWFVVFTAGTMYFNAAFDLSRRLHHLAFSMFTSIILINILMMALPFFDVLYYVNVTTLFVIVLLECLCMGAWIIFFHRMRRRAYPPASAIVVCDDLAQGREILKKINRHCVTNRVDAVCLYEEDSFGSDIEDRKSVV